mgnify:CR=1 FL=1
MLVGGYAVESDVLHIIYGFGIAVRTGHHCAQPLMERYGIEGTVRAAFALYNTEEEVDIFVKSLRRGMPALANTALREPKRSTPRAATASRRSRQRVSASAKRVRGAAPAIIASGGGSVVLNASDQSFIGKRASFAYGLTKGAIAQMAKSAALDLAPYRVRRRRP